MRRFAGILIAPLLLSVAVGGAAPRKGLRRAPSAQRAPAAQRVRAGGCPADMLRVRGFCIDRYEASLVERTTGRALSPWYPPDKKQLTRIREVWLTERRAWGDPGASAMPLPEPPSFQLTEKFEPKAVSRAHSVPSGYLSYYTARTACRNAGKRLCSEDEWVTACRGEQQSKFPYGAHYLAGKCNVHRAIHPGAVLHDNASVGLLDPRLNLVVEEGKDPLLRLTGATPSCASTWNGQSAFDMVGNLDEWVEDPSGVFVGGFYSRMTTKGCDAKVKGHAPSYFDYSTGTRCCSDPD